MPPRGVNVTERPTSRGIPRSSWRYAAVRAWHGFLRHRGIDSAAALTFFSSLAFFPAALAVVSAFAIGNGKRNASDVILDIAGEVVQPETVAALRDPVDQLFSVQNPGIGLAVGIVISLWSLSGYATAFGRAVNGVYEVHEGRQIWKFRGIMLVLAVFLLLAFAAIVVLLATTPRLATAIAEPLGIGEPWIAIWSMGRWPVMLLIVTLLVAVLYYFTPNVRHERFRWVSHGALFAVVAWAMATLAFTLYVATVGQYDRIYGWLGGGLVLLLWLYLTNLVMVLGAEVDAEVVRLRQLHAGIPAEDVVQLPMRDTTRNLILARQRANDEAEGRRIRQGDS